MGNFRLRILNEQYYLQNIFTKYGFPFYLALYL